MFTQCSWYARAKLKISIKNSWNETRISVNFFSDSFSLVLYVNIQMYLFCLSLSHYRWQIRVASVLAPISPGRSYCAGMCSTTISRLSVSVANTHTFPSPARERKQMRRKHIKTETKAKTNSIELICAIARQSPMLGSCSMLMWNALVFMFHCVAF